MSNRARVRVARVYDDPQPDDGQRVLVDRVWPRGFRKDDPRVGQWMPKVAPSTELRRWYGHRSERFDEFARRYTDELSGEDGAAALAELRTIAEKGTVTLLTAARDVDGSQAAVLATLLK